MAAKISRKKRAHVSFSKKAGLPPGSLVHVGEVKTPQPSLTLFAYDETGVEEHRFEDIESSRHYHPKGKKLWLNIYGLQNLDILKEVARRFHLHPLVQEDILNTGQRPKLEDYGTYLFMVMRYFEYDTVQKALVSDQVSLVIGKDYVISFQERSTGVFKPLRERLNSHHASFAGQNADYLAYALMDALVDQFFVVLEKLLERADSLEDDILYEQNVVQLKTLNGLKDEVRQMRRAIWPMREMLNTLSRADQSFFSSETRLYLRDVYEHVVQVLEALDTLRDQLADLLDIYMSNVSNRLNVEVRILTVLTMLFMPATLISGIFGMNFEQMPLLKNALGFWIAIAIMSGCAGVMAFLFWRRNMLKK